MLEASRTQGERLMPWQNSSEINPGKAGYRHWIEAAAATIGVGLRARLVLPDEVVDLFLPIRFYWVRRARWLKLQKARHLAASSPARFHQSSGL